MSRLRVPLMLLAKSDVGFLARLRFVASHVAFKLAALTLGAAYVSKLANRLRARRDRRAARPEFAGRVALVAHVFYPELMGEVLDCYARLPPSADLLLTTTPESFADVEARVSGLDRATVLAAANRGRDIAPFMSLLMSGALAPYDAVLKIHTKRSLHLLDGRIRRQLLFARLCGSRQRVSAILGLFADPGTGLVGWGLSWRRSPLYWMGNRERVSALAAAMRATAPDDPAFFEGSMFWLRPSALARLRALDLSQTDFEAEDGQLNATLHHAVERVFALAAAAEGYRVLDTSGRDLFDRTARRSR